MSTLNIGQLNIRPETDYEIYRNALTEAVALTIALTDSQVPFTVKYGAAKTTLDWSGAITVNVASGKSVTISHGDASVMQPVSIQITVR